MDIYLGRSGWVIIIIIITITIIIIINECYQSALESKKLREHFTKWNKNKINSVSQVTVRHKMNGWRVMSPAHLDCPRQNPESRKTVCVCSTAMLTRAQTSWVMNIRCSRQHAALCNPCQKTTHDSYRQLELNQNSFLSVEQLTALPKRYCAVKQCAPC